MSINGTYFDGMTSRKYDARLVVSDSHLVSIQLPEPEVPPGTVLLAELIISSRLDDVPRSLRFPGGQQFLTHDNDAIDELLIATESGLTQSLPYRLESHLPLVVASIVFIALFAVGFYQYAIPPIAEHASLLIPKSVEIDIGEKVLAEFEQLNILNSSALEQDETNELVDYFLSFEADEDLSGNGDGDRGDSPLPVNILFRSADLLGANALAIPGGTIVITDAMVELSLTDEELLAIYFHELGHVKHRHVIKQGLRDSILTLMIVALSGDVTAATDLATMIPSMLLSMNYSRQFETEADRYALDRLDEAGIHWVHFANIMRRLQGPEVGPSFLRSYAYLSTHPAPDERLSMIESYGTRSAQATGLNTDSLEPGPQPMSLDPKYNPDLDQVRAVVDSYFGRDREGKKARKRLKLWGNHALPYLWTLANSADKTSGGKPDITFGLHIVISIKFVGTPESTDMLLEIADGNSRIDPQHSVGMLHVDIVHDDKNTYLREHPAFKDIMFELISHPSWFTKTQVLEIIGTMSWHDGIPLILPLLKDDNLQVRETAALALEKLTGVRPSFTQPEVQFPSIDLRSDLVSQSRDMPMGSGGMSKFVKFTPWFDGKLSIVQSVQSWDGKKQTLRVFDTKLKLRESYQPTSFVHDFVMVPGESGGLQMVASVSENWIGAEYVAAFDKAGKVLWQQKREQSGVNSLAPVFGSDGVPVSLVVAHRSSEGIRGLSLDGQDLWQLKNWSVDAVETHPGAPNKFVAAGGTIKIFETNGRSVNLVTESHHNPFLYSFDIKVFVDSIGNLQIIAIGSGDNSTPTIMRFDHHLVAQWQASVPRRLGKLAMLKSQKAEFNPFFVATSEGQAFYVFDAKGALRYQDHFKTEESDSHVYWLEGMDVDGETGYFISGLLTKLPVYAVRLD